MTYDIFLIDMWHEEFYLVASLIQWISNLDSKIVDICVIDKIEREIEESEVVIAKLIQSKWKVATVIGNYNYFPRSAAHAVPPPPGEKSFYKA